MALDFSHINGVLQGKMDAATTATNNEENFLLAQTIEALNSGIAVFDADTEWTVPGTYSTLDLAVQSLRNVWVSPGATLTITLAAGVQTRTTELLLDHPCGSRMRLRGAAPVTLAVGAGAISIGNLVPASGAVSQSYPVTIPVATDVVAAGVAVGDYVLIRDSAAGVAYEAQLGFWRVSSLTTTQVTLVNTSQLAAFPTGATLTAASLTFLKTQIVFGSGTNGLRIGNWGSVDRLAIVGTRATGTAGVLTASPAAVGQQSQTACFLGTAVGVTGFDFGLLAQYGGSLRASGIVASGHVTNGLRAQNGGSIYAFGGVVSGCVGDNIRAEYGGSIEFEGGVSSGSGASGIQSRFAGPVRARSARSAYNLGAGLSAIDNGSLGAVSAVSHHNGTYGAQALGGSYVSVDTASIGSNVTGHINASTGGSVIGAAVFTSTGAISADRRGYVDTTGRTGTTPTNSQGTNGLLVP